MNKILPLKIFLFLGIVAKVTFFVPVLSLAAVIENIEIHQIEIEGVTLFGASDIESAMEITVGDKLDREKLSRTAKNIRDLYLLKGYRNVRIRSDLLKRKEGKKGVTVLSFIINEGHPTRIASITLIRSQVSSIEIQREWNRLKPFLLKEITVKAGGILDQEEISISKRALEGALSSEEFVGATAQQKETPTSEPEGFKKFRDQTSEWIDIEFTVDLGDRVTFGFRGNESLTQNELIEIVESQKVVGFRRNYIQDIRQKIIDAYKKMAFANVSVENYSFEKNESQERHLTYIINEGSRIKIESLDFEGNFVFSNNHLIDEFFRVAPPLIRRKYFVDEDVERGSQLLIDWMKSKGYLSSKIITTSKTFVPKKNSVRILMYIYEGELTVVRGFQVDGVTVFKPSKGKEIFSIKEGQPLNLFAFSEGLEKLKALYRELGYLDMVIVNEQDENVVRYFQKNQFADVYVQIREGPQYHVGKVSIQGLEETKLYIVQRELRIEEGDVLFGSKVAESEARIRRLGIFSTASINLLPSPGRRGFKNLVVSVKEATPGIVAGGPGFRSDLGLRLFGEFGYSNLGGQNHSWSITGAVNRRLEDFRFAEYNARVGYAWPWFMGVSDLMFRPSISQEFKQFIQFDARTTALKARFERPLVESIKLVGFFTYNYELTDQKNAKTDNPDLDNQSLKIGSIIPGVSVDFRDSPLAPTSGWFSSASYEIADPVFGSQRGPFPVGFHKFVYRIGNFVSFFDNAIIWYLSFRTGFERNTIPAILPSGKRDPRIGIPLSKQFALGGAGSLRGYKLQELNRQDKIVSGTLSFVNYRTQLDFPLTGQMRFGPFYDVANLEIDKYVFDIGLRRGWGVGFHYNTPIGPVNFDWGFKVKPKPGEDASQFYFSIGVL